MAKSKSGGTRAYIRGRVGSDVYSVGKTAKGKRQQVVRSLAETVANPQTTAQMRGRMIMSTIMQAVAALSPIIDHSFDNVSGKQPNISEFISRNYALIKADVAAHPASGNSFGLVKYQEKDAKAGAYVISAGAVPTPSAMVLTVATGGLEITVGTTNFTIGGLLTAMGLKEGDYVTIVGIGSEKPLEYARFYVKTGLDLTTAITTENVSTIFTIEASGSAEVMANTTSGKVTLLNNEVCKSAGFILSVKGANGWEHNDATMLNGSDKTYTADVALPTYPTGGADFLNGGDIFG